MANVDFPSGLQALRNRNGSMPEIMVMDCVTTVIYEGALAFASSTGLVRMCVSSVMSSTLAKKIVGVFANSKAAGAVGADGNIAKIRVYIDPEQEYLCQFDDGSATSLTSSINRIFSIVGVNTGNSTTLRSITEIDASTGAVTGLLLTNVNSQILQVMAFEKGINNDYLGSNARVVVKLIPKAHIHRNNSGV